LNIDIYKEIQKEYEDKREYAISVAEGKKEEAYIKYPKLKEIDTKIRRLGIEASKNALFPKDIEKQNRNKEIFSEIDNLKKEKESILNKSKFGITPTYECEKCKDTGYVSKGFETLMCSCMKQKLIDVAFNKSNLNKLKNDSFETFNDMYYSNEADIQKFGEKISPRDNILKIKERLIEFVNNFDNPNTKSVILIGTPGVGKTFLSSCVANAILKNGYTVLYQTAPLLLDSIFEYKYGSSFKSGKQFYEDIFHVDLLIIDDLGTETSTEAKYSELLNIINTRLLNSNTKTLISSNLSLSDIKKKYDHRLFSRIVGEYDKYRIIGDDIRLKVK